ncbi:MAG: glucose-6-phosphate dehydrogenase [Sphingomonas fennica]
MTAPAKADRAPPATIVIFGAMGDLARRLLAPAIVNLCRDGLVDRATTILGIGHGDGDDAALREALSEHVEDDACWREVRERISYLKGDFTDPAVFEALKARIEGAAVFYLATAPNFFGTIAERLGATGLLDEGDGFRRIVVEKPFGTDLPSAEQLDATLLAQAAESQIFRIDHFLGKETVQNIIVARFGNALVEATWNCRYVDHVQITAAETVTVGTRGKFYDATGALRDMVPNHLFQLLAMIGMEPPHTFEAEAIRNEKARLIAAICPPAPEDVVRGRYAAGRIGEEDVHAYRDEADVDADGDTETYVAMKLTVATRRWAGVPFYLRTGKAMRARDTEIVVQFKDPPMEVFRGSAIDRLPPNRLVIQIQPDEGISFSMAAKVPGPVVAVQPVTLDFHYRDHFELGKRTGYETLLYDVLIGDQTLYQRADQIEAAWAAVQPVLEAWGRGEGVVEDYPAGSDGPAAADALLARDGRKWHRIG